jgi:hypothetical protein
VTRPERKAARRRRWVTPASDALVGVISGGHVVTFGQAAANAGAEKEGEEAETKGGETEAVGNTVK